MASNLKKASSVIRKSFRTSKYSVFGSKDNFNSILEESPGPKWSARRESEVIAEPEVEVDDLECNVEQTKGKGLRSRGSAVTQSMREAVGNIRQKLKMSTRRRVSLKENTTPTRAGKRRQTFGGVKTKCRDVQMYSPFFIDTPTRNRNQIKTSVNMETPTRLRREVEALTANMQALNALTPNTLQTRSSTRKTPPITNGSLKTPRSSRRRVVTEL